MNFSELFSSISETFKDAKTSTPFNKEIYNNRANGAKNEFLFFIKPELTLDNSKIKHNDILNLIFGKLEEFDFNVKNIRVVNADYLKKHKIIKKFIKLLY